LARAFRATFQIRGKSDAIGDQSAFYRIDFLIQGVPA
jgi:hypothetical protein